jgi:hypothetical protein
MSTFLLGTIHYDRPIFRRPRTFRFEDWQSRSSEASSLDRWRHPRSRVDQPRGCLLHGLPAARELRVPRGHTQQLRHLRDAHRQSRRVRIIH